MDLTVKTLEGKDAGKVSLKDEIFGLEPREDILARMVRYQLAKKRQGSHKVKGRSEVALTGAKMYKQKGTGNARHHAKRAPQFRGGGRAHGPVVRDHAHDLPKKVRALALRLHLHRLRPRRPRPLLPSPSPPRPWPRFPCSRRCPRSVWLRPRRGSHG